MVQDKTGKIWFATTNGLYRYDGIKFTNILELDSSKNSNLELFNVCSIVEDKAGHIWFSSWKEGLCRFDGTTINKS